MWLLGSPRFLREASAICRQLERHWSATQLASRTAGHAAFRSSCRTAPGGHRFADSPAGRGTSAIPAASTQLHGCSSGGRSFSGINLPFAASHGQQAGLSNLSSSPRTVITAAAPAQLSRVGSPQGVLEGATAAEDEDDDGVIREGVGSPLYSSSSSSKPLRAAKGAKVWGGKVAGMSTKMHEGPSQPQVDEFLERHNIRIEHSGHQGMPNPVLSMDLAPFNQTIKNSIRQSGFTAPTAIQSVAWPIALERHNLVGIASTGSGKTAAYLYPALDLLESGLLETTAPPQDLYHHRHGSRALRGSIQPATLVLVPTRELAVQVGQQAERFGAALGLKSVVLYGGASRGGQMTELRRQRPPIVVATPGRLLDFVEEGILSLSTVQYLVVDEADRMLDMGFEPDVSALVKRMPRGTVRQTMMFSATWPREVRGLAANLLRGSENPTVHLYVGNVQEELVASPTVQQHAVVLHSKAQKLDALLNFLDQLRAEEEGLLTSGSSSSSSSTSRRQKQQHPRVLVFVNTKDGCEHLAWTLNEEPGMPRIGVLHGDKGQREREQAIWHFKSGYCPILVATDVAARGLDVQDVRAVVNFDVVAASRPQDHIHRIGRTGRAGAKGQALTLLVEKTPDVHFAPALVKIMTQAGQEVPQELHALANKSTKGFGSTRGSGFSRGLGHSRGSGFSRGGVAGVGGRGHMGKGGRDERASDKTGWRGDVHHAKKVGKQGDDHGGWRRNSRW